MHSAHAGSIHVVNGGYPDSQLDLYLNATHTGIRISAQGNAMNTIANSARPLTLLSAIAEFVRESLRSRGKNAMVAPTPAARELDLAQLYRLARGRETIDPAIGAMLAKRFDA
jgi:hypothetical protein